MFELSFVQMSLFVYGVFGKESLGFPLGRSGSRRTALPFGFCKFGSGFGQLQLVQFIFRSSCLPSA